jgi:hypothetical protein
MNVIAAKKDFVAIGRLAHNLRVQVRDIEAACERLGVSGAMRVNAVLYFDAAQVELITAELKKGAADA